MVKNFLISSMASFALAKQSMILADIKTDLAAIGKVATKFGGKLGKYNLKVFDKYCPPVRPRF